MKTISLNLRERILASYDADEGSRPDVANRYRVSLGLVKKLLQQRKNTGDIQARHRFSGRKPLILEKHRHQMKQLLVKQPDLTLLELREALGLACSLPTIHYALVGMDLTYKKRHFRPVSRIGKTSR